MDRFNQDLAKLAVEGVTVISTSGDSGYIHIKYVYIYVCMDMSACLHLCICSNNFLDMSMYTSENMCPDISVRLYINSNLCLHVCLSIFTPFSFSNTFSMLEYRVEDQEPRVRAYTLLLLGRAN